MMTMISSRIVKGRDGILAYGVREKIPTRPTRKDLRIS